MKIFENPLYLEDVKNVAAVNLQWAQLKEKSVLVTGATGLIGSMIIDVLMYKNFNENLNCKIYALARNEEKLQERFSYCIHSELLKLVKYDINKELAEDCLNKADFILHLASNTHPLLYSTDPIGTITTNLFGLKNILDFAVKKETTRVLFASSNEIYGENRGDVETFDEDYCGYINCNTLRAGYNESKRCGEALCQAYMAQKKLNIVIARITRTYGPTLLKTDTKALSQFLHKAINGEDIVLKSDGTQFFSYLYVSDTVTGIFYILLKGLNGEAYNIADEKSDIMLKDLAQIIASSSGKKVVFEIPDEVEKAGYSKATKARLNGTKLVKIGWNAKYPIKNGIEQTLKILKTLDF